MKRSALVIGILVTIILCVGIYLFFYSSQPEEYDSFQQDGISFKYPSHWKDYTEDVPEEDILVALGDPETVGFQNMSIPTTMIVIKKSSIPLNNSNTSNNLSEALISQNVNTMQALESQANTSYALFRDTLWSSLVNITQGKSDIPTVINELMITFFNSYSSYSGMNYTVQNITIDGIDAQEFTYQAKNGYSQETEYARIITFETRNDTAVTFYVIMCSARGNDMDSATEKFDTIIKSIKII